MYYNSSHAIAKKVLASRLSYLVRGKLIYYSGAALSREIGIGVGIIYKMRDGQSNGISFPAMLELAKKLNLSYEIIIRNDGKKDEVKINLEEL